MLGKIGLALVVLAAMIPVLFFILGVYSKKVMPTDFGLNADKQIQVCAKKTNCVSSAEGEDSESQFESLKIESIDFPKIVEIAKSMGIEEKMVTENYFYGTQTTDIFKFVDDVEFYLSDGQLQFKSASRVGRKDFNANRKRLDSLVEKLKAADSLQ